MMRRLRAWVFLLFFLLAFFTHAADKQPGCAVMTFEAKSGVSKDESAVLADGLESELIELKRYRMVSRANLGKVLEAQKISMECAGTECAIEAGKIAAIEYVVFGSIGKVGETYSLVANLANVETGVIEKTAKVTQSGKIDQLLISGVGVAAKRLMGLNIEETVFAGNTSPVSLQDKPVTLAAFGIEEKSGVTSVRFGGYDWEVLSGSWLLDGEALVGFIDPAGIADSAHVALAGSLPSSFRLDVTIESMEGSGWIGVLPRAHVFKGGRKWFRGNTSDIEGCGGINFSTDGQFNFFRGKGGDFFLVNPKWREWQRSELIRKQKNRVTWEVRGERFRVLFNDRELWAFTDNSLKLGTVVFAVGRNGCSYRLSDFSITGL